MIVRIAARWRAFLLGCVLLLAGLPAHADTPIALFQSFRGNLNFVGTEETLRLKDNTKPCSLVSSSTGIYAALSGIPGGATIKSAQLYWAGSGTSPDYTVTFDGVSITAPTSRQYTATATANNTTYTYFSGAADVTSQVAKKGNGTYTFSGLKVSTGEPWCSVQAVVGGFSLVVVYSHSSEPFRMLNLYEGFKDFRDTSLSISLTGFNVPNPLPSTVTGRVGHITWEGDVTLSQGGEDLLFNGYAMTDSMNPQGNQFNSQSNVTGDKYSYGIDFDIYTLKSPVIQAGQSSASTTYKSGQDLVLLSTEIVAMPYSAIADLSLSMTRTGDLTVGSATDYTLTVTNGGIDAETGPVTVVDTLPAGLKLVSAGGTKWTCTSAAGASSTTVVTCTQAGPIASGAKMTPITISVTPTGLGNYTNTATVSGQTGDNNLANNKATNTGGAVDYGSAAVVFTREACTDGQPIVVSPSETGCHKFIGPVIAGSTNTPIYITAVAGAQRATAIDSRDTVLPIDLKASCLPYSSVSASYAGTTLDCKGTWVSNINVTVPANKPSAALPNSSYFVYPDVGRVSLSLRYSGAVMGTVDFISKPLDIRFRDVFRFSDKVSDYEGGADDQYAFAKAGEQFVMRLGALMAGSTTVAPLWAPSFGKEPTALKGVLPDDQIDLDLQLDLFAANLKTSPRTPIAGKDDVVQDALVFDQGFTLNGTGNMDATVRWYEAGVFAVTPFLTDYLGTGKIGGPPSQDVIDADATKRFVASTRVIGRFYPDHFETTAVAPIACPAAVNCPLVNPDPAKTPPFPVSGAVYAQQPFTFSVEAFGLPRDGKPSILSLFENFTGAVSTQSPQGRAIVMSVVARPDGATVPAGGPLAQVSGKTLPVDKAVGSYPDLTASATYKLGVPYSAATQATRSATASWIAPTPIYLRASLTDAYLTGYTSAVPTASSMVVNSRVPATAAAGTRYEDGLMVLSGRLYVPNVSGSDLLRLPVPLTAQYWNGSSWVTNEGDDASIVAASLVPSSCMKFFAADGKSGACKANPLAPLGSLPLQLADGKSKLVIQAPTRGTIGSVDFSVDNGAANTWLPSTIGRATFGLYRSPLIYLREVY
jgi:MSHA biogenesis protein MshQ